MSTFSSLSLSTTSSIVLFSWLGKVFLCDFPQILVSSGPWTGKMMTKVKMKSSLMALIVVVTGVGVNWKVIFRLKRRKIYLNRNPQIQEPKSIANNHWLDKHINYNFLRCVKFEGYLKKLSPFCLQHKKDEFTMKSEILHSCGANVNIFDGWQPDRGLDREWSSVERRWMTHFTFCFVSFN